MINRTPPSLLLGAILASKALGGSANIPQGIIRGVNLGGLFIVEPWMMGGEWSAIGCGDYPDEYTCMQNNPSAQAGFESHWANWITQDDINQMASYGLNTVRIPVGHWIVEDTKTSDDHYATGGFTYLKRLLSWISDAGMYAEIDLHAAPQVQTENQAFTGHTVDTPGFYNQDSFGRAKLWAWNMTQSKSNDPDFAAVFAIEAVNEPTRSGAQNGLIDSYYPTFYQTVRDTEAQLGVSCGATNTETASRKRDWVPRGSNDVGLRKRTSYTDCLNIVFMAASWGSGNPSQNLPSGYTHVIFDDHRYFAYSGDAYDTRSEVLAGACDANSYVNAEQPVMAGEFSLALINENGDFSLDSDGGLEFYQQYAASEVSTFEKSWGWTWWTWKTETDFAWSYTKAVDAGILPSDASQIAQGPSQC
ncbi:glycoside hydrolase family 5 protein [Atractiella rhizophila]|nr:glycoside hydrolase family 5 protein [Atractiella rhizophila]